MEILLCGGFLGSGKTTLINKALHGITGRGLTAALIENEVCQDGIDAELTEQKGLQVFPLFGGCVCCQLSGDLLNTVNRLEDELNPDWVVVEMTGLAMLDGIRDTFRQYGRPGMAERLRLLTVVDLARWSEKFIERMGPVVHRQLAGAEVVVANKADVAAAAPAVLERIAALAPGAAILPMSAAEMEPEAVWSALLEALP